MKTSLREEKTSSKDNDSLTDIVIGMSDGLVIPFALTAGLYGADFSNQGILTAGVIATLAGSIFMSFGGYQAGRSAIVRPRHGHGTMPGADPLDDKRKAKEFLANIGLSEEMQQKAIDEMEKDEQQWSEFVAKYGADEQTPRKAGRSALNIGLSYLIAGAVPLLPYYLIDDPAQSFKVSIIVTLLVLFLFGLIRGRIMYTNMFVAALRATLVGALAAGAAYGAASFFGSV